MEGQGANTPLGAKWPRRKKIEMAALLGCLLLGVVLWLVLRSPAELPWDNQAITARFQDLTIQQPAPDLQKPGDVHVILSYALTNLTGHDYRIPAPSLGVLMKHLPEGGLQEVDSVSWDSQALIPARKTANVQFDVTIPAPSNDAGPEPEHPQQDLGTLGSERLRGIRGLVFFDYGRHYSIELPRGWD